MTDTTELYGLSGCEIDSIEQRDSEVIILAHTHHPTACCPTCAQPSTHVHSYYTRHPQDLPMSEWPVRLCLRVRRFRCLNPTCPQKTFAERMPAFLSVHAQRTRRLITTLCQIGLALGGEAGARLSRPLHMPASPATLLRMIRQADVSLAPSPCVLGVDDFALRKGDTYGTLLVDLARRRPVDLLPDRTAATLADWLQKHPGIEVIARDRSTEYASGASAGAPAAQQVADRWYLLQNVRQMLERLCTRLQADLRQLPARAAPATDTAPAPVRADPYWRTHADEQRQQASRARRLQLYTEVQRLRQQGYNILQIARQLAIAHGTARKYFYPEHFPERGKRRIKPSILDPYVPYLVVRQQAGCENAHQLWREIRTQGYPGTPKQVGRWVQQQRTVPAPTTPAKYRARLRPNQVQTRAEPSITSPQVLPSARQLAWLLVRSPATLTSDEAQILVYIQQHPDVQTLYPLIQQFVTMVRQRVAASLDEWLQACTATGIACLQTFAAGIQQDYAAVRAALETAWSSGQTEGQINRLKLIKRQMYGRANFDLLRLRVLAA